MSVPGGLYSTLISGATPFSGSYLQYASSGVQQASYTFAAQNIGVADTSRMIVVAVSASTTSTSSSSCTIGGIAATKLAEVAAAVSGHYQMSTIYAAMVPIGTTANVVVNYPTNNYFCAISLYRLVGMSSVAAYATNTKASVSPYSTTLNVPANGFAIGCSSTNNGSSATTWSGLTLNYDILLSTERASAASASFVSAVTPLTITATIASGTDAGALAVASFKGN